MKWISVKDRLPAKNSQVLCCRYHVFYDGGIGYVIFEANYIYTGKENYSFVMDGHDTEVTHWMPRPDPPETEKP